MVTVRFFAAAKSITKVDQVEIEAITVNQVLEKCVSRFPGLQNAFPKCSYLLNSQACQNLDTEVRPGDVLDVLPPFAGG